MQRQAQFRLMLWKFLADHLPKLSLFLARQESHPVVILRLVSNQACRIFSYFARPDRKAVGQREKGSVAVPGRCRPFLCLEMRLDFLWGDGIGGPMAKPLKQLFHPAVVIPRAALVPVRVGQRVLGDLAEAHWRAAQFLGQLAALKRLLFALVIERDCHTFSAGLLAAPPAARIVKVNPPHARVGDLLEESTLSHD